MDLKIRVRKTKEELNEKGGKKEEKTQKKREKENWWETCEWAKEETRERGG